MENRRQRVVITGASSGIGAATAEEFARRGAELVLASRNLHALEEIARRCRALGGEADAVRVDVTDGAAVRKLALEARERLGGIDLWFSNVGVGALGRFHEVPLEAHRRVIEANLIGHLNDAHAVLPIFIEQQRGIFVNMASVGAFAAAPMAAAYSASKFGLRGLSQALRAELSAYPDIHICDIYPTLVDTPAFGHSGNFTGSGVSVSSMSMDPRAVAKAVVRLADRPRSAVAVGAPLLAMKAGQFLAPNLVARIVGLTVRKALRDEETVPATAGNLFQAPDDEGRVDGGHRLPARRRNIGIVAAVAGAGAIAGAALLIARRPAKA